MLVQSAILCSLVLSSPQFFAPQWLDARPEYRESAQAICVDVADKALEEGVDPIYAIALSYSESRFTNSMDKPAKGPLQVMPHHHCPNRKGEWPKGVQGIHRGVLKGCDLVRAGLKNIARLTEAYGLCEEDLPVCDSPDWETVLCHYTNGTVCRHRQYPKAIVSRARKIGRIAYGYDAENARLK